MKGLEGKPLHPPIPLVTTLEEANTWGCGGPGGGGYDAKC